MSNYCAEVLAPAPHEEPQRESGPRPAIDRPEPMPDVKVLLIRQRADGFFLERFNDRGEFVGDTRHDELDDAMRHAYSNYGPISDWHFCPDDVPPLEYIRTRSES